MTTLMLGPGVHLGNIGSIPHVSTDPKLDDCQMSEAPAQGGEAPAVKGMSPQQTQPIRSKAWVTYMDVYGFKNLVQSKYLVRLYNKLQKARNAALQEISMDTVTHTMTQRRYFYAFSDSMCIIYPTASMLDTRDQLRLCIDDAQRIMAVFAQHGLPLRGGVAHDDVCLGPTSAIGPGIVRAVEYEKMVPCPLALLTKKDIDKTHATSMFQHSSYDIILKRDEKCLIKGHLIYPSPLSDYLQLIRNIYADTSTHGPSTVAFHVRTALMHLRRLLQDGEITVVEGLSSND